MASIELIGGQTALVDDSDLHLVAAYRWRSQGGYAAAARGGALILMHRLILGVQQGEIVDHKDGNPLNNTRANLRVCSHAENMRNRRRHSNNSSGVKGVHLEQRPGRRERWVAEIRVDGRKIALGRYDTRAEAALAYKIGAYKYHGAFARTA